MQRLVEVDYADRRRGDLITFKAITAAVKSVPFGDTPKWVERVERPMPLLPFEEPKPDKIVVTLELTKDGLDAMASLLGKTECAGPLDDAHGALLLAGGNDMAFDVTPRGMYPNAALKLTRRNS